MTRRLLTFVIALAATITTVAPATAVVNGVELADGERPYLVSLGNAERYAKDGNLYWGQFCGGTLIAPQVVLTAGHCVTNYNHSAAAVDITPATDIVVGAGTAKLSEQKESRVVSVVAVVVHPAYIRGLVDTFGQANDYDLALLELSATPAGAAPLRVADAATVDAVTAGNGDLSTAGWGYTGRGWPDGSAATGLSAIANSVCSDDTATATIYSPDGTLQRQIYGLGFRLHSVFNPASMICALGLNNLGQVTDSCFGDSGGPLVLGEGAAAQLVGVVSWGPLVAGEVCATEQPGIYAQADDYVAAVATVPIATPTAKLNGRVLTATVGLRPLNLGQITLQLLAADQVVDYCQLPATATCSFSGLKPGRDYTVRAGSSLGAISLPSASVRLPAGKVPTAARINAVKLAYAGGAAAKATFTVSAKSATALKRFTVTCIAGAKQVTGSSRTGTVRLSLARKQTYLCTATATNAAGSSIASSKRKVTVG